MKVIVTVLCLLLPVAAIAETQGMNGVDMQKMMQLMQEMQQCMAKVDQAEIEVLQEESEKMGKELEALCEKGERKKAQKKAMAYSKKIMVNPAMAQMKKCGEITKGMMPGMEMPSFDEQFDVSGESPHVCDQ